MVPTVLFIEEFVLFTWIDFGDFFGVNGGFSSDTEPTRWGVLDGDGTWRAGFVRGVLVSLGSVSSICIFEVGRVAGFCIFDDHLNFLFGELGVDHDFIAIDGINGDGAGIVSRSRDFDDMITFGDLISFERCGPLRLAIKLDHGTVR